MCILYTVNCQLSTVTFLTHPGMSPGCLHTICQSMSGKILFKHIFKNIIIFLARDLGQFHDISWHWIMTGLFCHDWMKMLKFLFQTFLTISLRFYHENSNQNHSSPVTCHLSPVTWHLSTSHSAASCEIMGFIDFARFGKKFINPVPVVQFSNFQRILGGKYLLHDRKY